MGASSSKEVQRNNTFEVPRRVASKSCATKSKKSVHKVNAVHDFIVEPTEIFTYESMRTPSKSCLSSTSRKLSSNSTVDSFKPTRRASVDLYDLRRNSRRASQEIGDRERHVRIALDGLSPPVTPGQADEDDDEEETEVNDVNDGYSLDIISPQASFELSPNQHHRNLNSCQSSKKRFGVKTVSKSSPQLLDLSLGPAQSTPHDSTPHSYTPVQRIEVMPASRRRASIDIPDSSRDLRKWQSLPATSRGRGRSNSTACYDVVSLVFAVDPEPYAL